MPMTGAVGETLTVSARGLPSDTTVIVGAGRPQAAFEIVERARTSADGTLQVSIRIPDWAAEARHLTIVVAAEDDSWRIRSQPITVMGAKL
jgi:hypothetical protein